MPKCINCNEPIEDGDHIARPYTGEGYYHADCYRDGGGSRYNCDFYVYSADDDLPGGTAVSQMSGTGPCGEKLVAPPESVSPQHYKDGRIEAIDAIRSALGHQGFKDYCRGQVIRYLWRIGKKDDELVEVGKAQCYLRWMKETMDGKELSK
jgi:hypothetical protein